MESPVFVTFNAHEINEDRIKYTTHVFYSNEGQGLARLTSAPTRETVAPDSVL